MVGGDPARPQLAPDHLAADKWSGLLPTGKPGIIVGGWTDRRGGLRYLTDTGQAHAVCLGPTRSGKSAGVLVPTLLSWPHSAIVYDPKGELWQMTAGWRHSEAGNVVMRFAPAELGITVATSRGGGQSLRSNVR